MSKKELDNITIAATKHDFIDDSYFQTYFR